MLSEEKKHEFYRVNAGYESRSGLSDAFSKIIGAAPTPFGKQTNILKASWLETPLGPMLAIADERFLYLLEFIECRGLEREIERLRIKTKSAIIPGATDPITSIQRELKSYFDGTLKIFETPIFLLGNPFQKLAWEMLTLIPYGETRSYLAQAIQIGRPSASRAVANANGANQIAIVIPCHRIINSNGNLGGYGGGIGRKIWLLEHERKNK
jgi:AraC family transcriptional regulator of adaptative response/methylated-DNA-[protein]-cysteine methyltransferase